MRNNPITIMVVYYLSDSVVVVVVLLFVIPISHSLTTPLPSCVSKSVAVAALLQIKAVSYHRVITTSNMVAYGEVIVKQNTLEKALDVRDAISKSLYGRLFSWIVSKINPALRSSRK